MEEEIVENVIEVAYIKKEVGSSIIVKQNKAGSQSSVHRAP